MPFRDGTILRAAIAGALTGVAGRFGLAPAAVPAMADAVVETVGRDPRIANAVNAEHPAQSRVVLGSSLALLGGLFTGAADLYAMARSGAFDPDRAGASLAIVLGAAYALYGRLRGGLAPLFWRLGRGRS